MDEIKFLVQRRGLTGAYETVIECSSAEGTIQEAASRHEAMPDYNFRAVALVTLSEHEGISDEDFQTRAARMRNASQRYTPGG